MERLTWNDSEQLKVCGSEKCNGKCSVCQPMDEAIEKLKVYEDAEEQGMLLRLPYPFGTKLYYVIDDWDYGMSVNEVIFDLEFVSDVLRYTDEYYCTREEAEQALAEMQKG